MNTRRAHLSSRPLPPSGVGAAWCADQESLSHAG